MAQVRGRKPAIPAKNDVYVGMLLFATLAMGLGIGLLVHEGTEYDWVSQPKGGPAIALPEMSPKLTTPDKDKEPAATTKAVDPTPTIVEKPTVAAVEPVEVPAVQPVSAVVPVAAPPEVPLALPPAAPVVTPVLLPTPMETPVTAPSSLPSVPTIPSIPTLPSVPALPPITPPQ